MKKKIIVMLFLFALVSFTGTVNAAQWSIPGTDPNTPYWDIAENWTPVGVPGAADDAQFTGASEVECIVRTAAACNKFAVGDNGPTTFTRKVRIVDGGSLVYGNNGAWGTSGYNRDSIVTVEEGGSLEGEIRFGIGLVAAGAGEPQTSYLNINGGDMAVGGNLQIGSVGDGTTSSDHTGIVNVLAGTLNVAGNLDYRDPSDPGIGLIDIRYGTLTVESDITGDIPARSASGTLTAFGGAGTLHYDFDVTNPGKTTITATHPMDPSPLDITVPIGDVVLSWTNLAPIVGDTVYVDVWFGTDPNKLDLLHYSKVITAPTTGVNKTTVTVSAPANDTYYWQVDSYINGAPYDEPNMIEGDVWSFIASNDASPTNVNAGVDMNTWANEPTPLNGTYTDDGVSTVDITWTSSNPSAVFDPSNDGGLTSNVVNPTVIVDNAAGAVTLTFTVQDQLNPPVSDEMIINVYADACEAARVGAGLADQYPLDVVVDCVIDLKDLAAMLAIWLEDYALTGPIPGP